MSSASVPPSADAPPAHSLFAPARDRHGLRLAWVLGNEAPDGLCPYYRAGRCHHCDIGAGEGRGFDAAQNAARIEWLTHRYADLSGELAHLVVYNSGSTLNPRELCDDTLARVLAVARDLPSATVISFDSREPYVVEPRLLRLARGLRADQQARVILGLESADNHVRDALLQKRMPRSAVERAFAAVGAVAAREGGRAAVDVNVVIAAPGVVDAAADAAATASYCWQLGARHGVSVDLNLHPYYPSARSQARFPDHPRCSLAQVAAAARSIAAERATLAPSAGMFIGWEDEGHDREQQRRQRELATARAAFERFNETQQPQALDGLAAAEDAHS